MPLLSLDLHRIQIKRLYIDRGPRVSRKKRLVIMKPSNFIAARKKKKKNRIVESLSMSATK